MDVESLRRELELGGVCEKIGEWPSPSPLFYFFSAINSLSSYMFHIYPRILVKRHLILFCVCQMVLWLLHRCGSKSYLDAKRHQHTKVEIDADLLTATSIQEIRQYSRVGAIVLENGVGTELFTVGGRT